MKSKQTETKKVNVIPVKSDEIWTAVTSDLRTIQWKTCKSQLRFISWETVGNTSPASGLGSMLAFGLHLTQTLTFSLDVCLNTLMSCFSVLNINIFFLFCCLIWPKKASQNTDNVSVLCTLLALYRGPAVWSARPPLSGFVSSNLIGGN